jgi:hypothetical protein
MDDKYEIHGVYKLLYHIYILNDLSTPFIKSQNFWQILNNF